MINPSEDIIEVVMQHHFAILIGTWSRFSSYPRFPNGVWYCEIYSNDKEEYEDWLHEHMTGFYMNLQSISDKTKFYLYLMNDDDVMLCSISLPADI